MAGNSCPDQDALRWLLAGQFPSPQAEALEKHLLTCARCTAAVRRVAVDDELSVAMRTCRVVLGDSQVLVDVIERAKLLGSEIETTTPHETRVVGSPGHNRNAAIVQTHSARDESFDFLSSPERPDEIGRLGGYRVLEVMGCGGMGIVFRAEDPKLERLVALKVMKPSVAASSSARNRFLREAKAAAAIEHDNIVTIHQVAEDGDIPFIAMQLLRGESLQSRLEREGRLEQSEAVRICLDVARGLDAAHQRGLIHRDIKPGNVWLEAHRDRAKILDFGLARTGDADAGITQSGIVLGTPRYMAPEQAQGHVVDHRCDLFSLGSVLYHLVSGKPPFEGPSLTAILLAVSQAQCLPIQEVLPEADPELARLITKLLCKDPGRRPQSAAAVAESLVEIETRLTSARDEETAVAQGEKTTVLPSLASPLTYLPLRNPVVLTGALATLAVFITLGLWAAGVILRFNTADGTILIEIDGAGEPIEINVTQDKTVEIKDPNDGILIQVAIDREKQQLRLQKQGFKLAVASFSLESPSGRTVRVAFEPAAAESPQTASAGDNRRGWPPDAPPLATAPFGSEQAKKHQESWANYLGLPVERVLELPAGQTLTLLLIPPGEFQMGLTIQEQTRLLDEAQAAGDKIALNQVPCEGPQHPVRISRPFYLGKCEVTQAQWEAMTGNKPAIPMDSPSHPVRAVSGDDIQLLLEKLNESSQQLGLRFVLPTEAEWEYACRAGTSTPWHCGNEKAELRDFGWFSQNSRGALHPVGQLRPNSFGLHDMHGNVWEWCADWYAPDYYTYAPAEDPYNRATHLDRVLRGGSIQHAAVSCRSATRFHYQPSHRVNDFGFRLAAKLTQRK